MLLDPPLPPDTGDNGTSNFPAERSLDQQETEYELRWKSQFLLGKPMTLGQDVATLDADMELRTSTKVSQLRAGRTMKRNDLAIGIFPSGVFLGLRRPSMRLTLLSP